MNPLADPASRALSKGRFSPLLHYHYDVLELENADDEWNGEKGEWTPGMSRG